MADTTGSLRQYAPTQLLIFPNGGKLDGAAAVHITDPADVDELDARVLYLRNITNVTGECPECGATLSRPSRRQRRLAVRAGVDLVVRVHHADGCPAGDPNVRDIGSARAASSC